MAATGFLFSFIYIIRGVQVNTEKKGEIIRKTWKVLEQKMDRMRAIRNFLEIVVYQTNFPYVCKPFNPFLQITYALSTCM